MRLASFSMKGERTMNLQPILGKRSQRALESTRIGGELECLRCRYRFDVNDLHRVHYSRNDRGYIECIWCEARNEVHTIAPARAGAPSRTVVLRIVGPATSDKQQS
jgi:hypothetical protein